jgi:hypothetical protein
MIEVKYASFLVKIISCNIFIMKYIIFENKHVAIKINIYMTRDVVNGMRRVPTSEIS